MRAVVVSFDHLPVGFLGCHGNTWIDTPNIDRLAAEGIVFDQHFAECIGPSASHAWWTGCLQFPAKEGEARGAEFATRLREKDVRTTLLVEEPSTRPIALPTSFDEVESVSGEDGLDVDPRDTPFAKLVGRAIERLSSTEGSELLWLKSRGVPVPWLPSRALAERFVALFEDLEDEEDDEPRPTGDDLEWVALEDLHDDEEEEDADESFDEDEADWDEEAIADDEEIDEAAEFDEMLRALASVGGMEHTEGLDESDWMLVRAVYGGYVALLDESLGRLRAALDDDVLLIVTVAEGESLGERVGFEEGPGRLGEEYVHTPLLVVGPDVRAGARVKAFTQPIDIAPTLLDWFAIEEPGRDREGRSLLPIGRGDAEPAPRDFAVSGTTGEGEAAVGLRTSRFYSVSQRSADDATSSDERHGQLFVKPEDVWEIHDTSDQLPEESRSLVEAADRILADCSSSGPAAVSLSAVEVNGEQG